MNLVGHFTLPRRICKIVAFIIRFSKPMHLCRISQAFLPNFVTDDLHFENLEILQKPGQLRCLLSFTSNFCEIHIYLTNKLRATVTRLLRDIILNVDYVLCEFLDIDTSSIVDL